MKWLKREMWAIKLILLLSVASVVVLPLCFIAYMELYVKPFIESYPLHQRPYVQHEPFFSTSFGVFTEFVWLATVVVFSYMIAKRLCAHPKKLLKAITVGCIIIAFFVALLSIESAVSSRWNYTNVVDVLCIGDEEFLAHSNYVTNAESVLADVNTNKFSEFGILFSIRGWLSWDSLDTRLTAYSLMQEALAESGLPRQKVEVIPGYEDWGFISGSEWLNADSTTMWIDHLLIFTGQDCDVRGMSIPQCNMTLIRYDSVGRVVLTHELGHQYYLAHCGDVFCIMNDYWHFSDNFCGNCKAKLNDARDKWMTDSLVYFGLYYTADWHKEPGYYTLTFSSTIGTYSPSQKKYVEYGSIVNLENWKTPWGWGNWIRIRCGTLLTVKVTAYSEYAFKNCSVENAPPIYTTNPNDPPQDKFWFYTSPFTFYINDTWAFAAFFVKKTLPGGSSGGFPIYLLY